MTRMSGSSRLRGCPSSSLAHRSFGSKSNVKLPPPGAGSPRTAIVVKLYADGFPKELSPNGFAKAPCPLVPIILTKVLRG